MALGVVRAQLIARQLHDALLLQFQLLHTEQWAMAVTKGRYKTPVSLLLYA